MLTQELTAPWQTPVEDHRLVLLAEDDDDVSGVLASILKRSGFLVVLASDGKEALQLFVRHLKNLSLVVVDEMMPHLRGSEIIPRMRRMKDDIPIILMSGYDEKQMLEWTGRTRPDLCLQKPFSSDTLNDAIARVIRRTPIAPETPPRKTPPNPPAYAKSQNIYSTCNPLAS